MMCISSLRMCQYCTLNHHFSPAPSLMNLLRSGKHILPGIEFNVGVPARELDLRRSVFWMLAGCALNGRVRLDASAWAGSLLPEAELARWREVVWPFGGLAAGGLGAGEAFKIAISKLLPRALNQENMRCYCADVRILASIRRQPATVTVRTMVQMDFVSGGAIANSVLYSLARIPDVRGEGRIIEPHTADYSNLNRNMLLL